MTGTRLLSPTHAVATASLRNGHTMISTGLRIVGARINTSTGRAWVCCLILTAALGSLLSVLRVPSGWLIGALIAAGCMAVLTGDELTPAKRVLRPAQGCIGVMAAAPLAGLATATM